MDEGKFTIKYAGKKYPVYYIKNREDAKTALISLAKSSVTFGVDIETTGTKKYKHLKSAGLNPHYSKIRLLQISNGKSIVVFDMRFIKDFELFKVFLSNVRSVAHYAVFELMFFRKIGITHMNMECSMLASKVLTHAVKANDAGINSSLEALSQYLFKEDLSKAPQKSNWGRKNLTFEQIRYAAIDAIATKRIFETLIPYLEKYKVKKYYELCRDAQHPIVSLQLNGLRLKQKPYIEMFHGWRHDLIGAKKELEELTNLDKITAHTLAKWLEENLDNETLLIWPRTDKGKIKTDAHTFADFDFLDIIEPLAIFQKKKKLCTSFGASLIEKINQESGKIHCRFSICGTRTGRLSCSQPNLQQLPRDKRIRKKFIPRKGWKFLCADYSQIELRVAAELSQDKNMLKAYRQGVDLHRKTASVILGKPLSQVTKKERQMAKAVNFGFLFGLGAKKFSHYAKKSYKVDVSPKDAKNAITAFRQTYPGYYDWQMRQASLASVKLFSRTPYGKLRKLDPTNTYGTAMNTPVQGGAAECMLWSIIFIEKKLRRGRYKAQLSNCVHDEILIEAPVDEVDDIKKIIETCMVKGFLKVFPNGITRGIVEVGVGKSWGGAKV